MHALLLEDIEDLRRKVRIGTVVEGERKLAWGRPLALNDERGRHRRIFLVDDLSRVAVDLKRALAFGRIFGHVQDLALAFEVDVLASPDTVQVLRRRCAVAAAKGRPY